MDQFGATKKIKRRLFAIQVAREEVLIKKNNCTRCFHARINSLFNAKVHWYSKINPCQGQFQGCELVFKVHLASIRYQIGTNFFLIKHTF